MTSHIVLINICPMSPGSHIAIASDSALSARIRIDALMQWILQYQQPQHKHDLHDSLGYCSEYNRTSILSGS